MFLILYLTIDSNTKDQYPHTCRRFIYTNRKKKNHPLKLETSYNNAQKYLRASHWNDVIQLFAEIEREKKRTPQSQASPFNSSLSETRWPFSPLGRIDIHAASTRLVSACLTKKIRRCSVPLLIRPALKGRKTRARAAAASAQVEKARRPSLSSPLSSSLRWSRPACKKLHGKSIKRHRHGGRGETKNTRKISFQVVMSQITQIIGRNCVSPASAWWAANFGNSRRHCIYTYIYTGIYRYT